MSATREILFFPKALRDLAALERAQARQILDDIELLRTPPWPPGKAKKLTGTPLWEIKTGDFRSLFLPMDVRVVVVRVVNRRDLLGIIQRLDPRSVFAWLRGQRREDQGR